MGLMPYMYQDAKRFGLAQKSQRGHDDQNFMTFKVPWYRHCVRQVVNKCHAKTWRTWAKSTLGLLESLAAEVRVLGSVT